MATNPKSTHSLLAILAHPDDESFGMGGTLALYASRGVEVNLICATRGEVGTVDPELLDGHESIAELRGEKELHCAAVELGLNEVHFLDYRDSGMPGSPENDHPNALLAAPEEEVAEKLVCYIRKLRPHIIVTHDPIGGYKHPDHIAVHHAVLRAFHQAADPDFDVQGLPPHQADKLFYTILSLWWLRPLIRILPFFGVNLREFGRNKDIDLIELANEGSFPVHAVINYQAVAEKKVRASACHASQLAGGPPRRGLFGLFSRLIGNREHFMQAYPPVESGPKSQDLFAGIPVDNPPGTV
jgi:LmbE family N-acetylglucosaminyl deacetylase